MGLKRALQDADNAVVARGVASLSKNLAQVGDDRGVLLDEDVAGVDLELGEGGSWRRLRVAPWRPPPPPWRAPARAPTNSRA